MALRTISVPSTIEFDTYDFKPEETAWVSASKVVLPVASCVDISE